MCQEEFLFRREQRRRQPDDRTQGRRQLEGHQGEQDRPRHRPAEHDLGHGLRRVVLSDWDLDDAAHQRAEVLRLTRDGFRRLPVAA